MQIALTGASGFVGTAFIRAAVRRGHEVVAFSRNPARIIRDTIATRPFSLSEIPDFTGCDSVVHLAGEPVAGLWTPSKVARIRSTRVEGTRRVVEGIRRMAGRIESFVCASATGYYGDCGEQELTEDSPAGVGFLPNVCKEWESEVLAAGAIVREVRLRFGLVLGGDGGALRVLAPLFRWGLGGRVGHGRQWWSWIHVDDAASLIVYAIENLDARGPMNATTPWPARNSDFTRILAETLRRPALFPAPAWFLRILLRGFAEELLNSRRVLPGRATQLGFPFRFPDLAPALKDALRA